MLYIYMFYIYIYIYKISLCLICVDPQSCFYIAIHIGY